MVNIPPSKLSSWNATTNASARRFSGKSRSLRALLYSSRFSSLRDVTTENELELNQRIKELEIENYELLEVKGKRKEKNDKSTDIGHLGYSNAYHSPIRPRQGEARAHRGPNRGSASASR